VDAVIGRKPNERPIMVTLARMRVPVGAIAPFVIDPKALASSADEHLVRLENEARESDQPKHTADTTIVISGEA
jgi:hypothetical protein